MEDILILGAGRVGGTLASTLSQDKFKITVIDTDQDKLRELDSKYDLRTVLGNAADPSVLQRADVEDASVVVAVTAIDEVNLVACKVCSILSENITKIARIRSNQYSDDIIHHGFGIEKSFCPEELVAQNFINTISHPGCLSVNRFANNRLVLAGIRISSNADIAGSTVRDLRQKIQEIDYRIVSVYRDNKYILPDADTRLFVGDDAYLLVAAENLNELAPFLAGPQEKNHRIFIAGGGNIGTRVAKALEANHDIKILDKQQSRHPQLTKELSNTLILKGHASDESLLRQEKIDDTDIFCALTSDDEENILSSMLAKRLGAKKTAVLINRLAYMEILERQLDTVLSPAQITIGSVLALIRHGTFNTVHSLQHGAAEAVEMTIVGDKKTSQLVGREVQEVEWPDGTMPGALLRNDEIIIAHDNTLICDQDHIICFVSNREAVGKMEKLVQVSLEYTGRESEPDD